MTVTQLIETVNSQSPSLEEIMRVDGHDEEMAEKIRSSFLLKFEGSENAYPTLLENIVYQSNIWEMMGWGGVQFNTYLTEYEGDWIEFAVYNENPIVFNRKSGEIAYATPWSLDKEIKEYCSSSFERFFDAMLSLHTKEVARFYRNKPITIEDIEELIHKAGGKVYAQFWLRWCMIYELAY
jgi:hypothetical protein